VMQIVPFNADAQSLGVDCASQIQLATRVCNAHNIWNNFGHHQSKIPLYHSGFCFGLRLGGGLERPGPALDAPTVLLCALAPGCLLVLPWLAPCSAAGRISKPTTYCCWPLPARSRGLSPNAPFIPGV